MSELTKYTLEFPIQSSINILYSRLSTPGGLSRWFADDIIITDKIFTFFWDDMGQKARLLKKKKNSFIRFKWEENETKEDYFEFCIQIDEITSDVSLLITDFSLNAQDQEEQTALWKKQVENLKGAIGS